MLRLWGVPAIAATAGWLIAVLALVVGVRPLGWVLVGAAVATLVSAGSFLRGRPRGHVENAGMTFACIILLWPILALVTLAIASIADPRLTGQ